MVVDKFSRDPGMRRYAIKIITKLASLIIQKRSEGFVDYKISLRCAFLTWKDVTEFSAQDSMRLSTVVTANTFLKSFQSVKSRKVINSYGIILITMMKSLLRYILL